MDKEGSPMLVDDVAGLRRVLQGNRVIAVVGLSPSWNRPSYFAAKYMLEHGYTVIPVNPAAPEILGQKSYPDLASIPVKVDMVDVFRKPEDALPIAREAVRIGARCLWLQLGVINREAAALASRRRARRGHGSLREDRVRAPVRRPQLCWRQYAGDLGEATVLPALAGLRAFLSAPGCCPTAPCAIATGSAPAAVVEQPLRQLRRIELALHRGEQHRAALEESALATRRYGPVVVLARGEDELQLRRAASANRGSPSGSSPSSPEPGALRSTMRETRGSTPPMSSAPLVSSETE
jgi:predicted CoA-binding protein